MQNYLNTLFNESDDSYILVWHKKLSYYYKKTELKDIIKEYNDKEDVYIGVNTRKKDLGVHKKGSKGDIDKVYCLWMDLDLENEHHQKSNLFKDIDSFYKVIEDNRLYEPSITVKTGGGYHFYWMLKEPFFIESKEDRIKIEALCKMWQSLFSDLSGKNIDSTWNVDRVLRLPDTVNSKYGNDVIAENINDNQYSIDDFTNIVGEIDKSLVSIDSTSSKDKYDFEVSKDAQPPFDKFHAMLENVPGFKETWEHKRKDMADDSQSGYDLSLATFMAKSGANFTEQEMVNTLIKNRMKFGNHIDKIKRKRYYARTIKKARQAVETEKIHDRLDDYKLLTSEERKEERGKIRNELSKALGVKIDRIIKYKFGESGEKSEYLIHSNDEIISLPDVTYLIHQRKFDKIVADMLGYRMKHIKSKRWRDISQYLLDVCYLIDLGEAGTTYGMVVDNFEKYLETWGCPVKDDEINKEALYMKMREKEPFIDDDWLYIHFTHYLTHLNRTTSIRKKASDIVKIFKRLGFEKKQVRYKSNQNWETRRYWKIRYNNIRRLVKNHEN